MLMDTKKEEMEMSEVDKLICDEMREALDHLITISANSGLSVNYVVSTFLKQFRFSSYL